jgi:DNA topoisomerase-1
LFIYNWIPNHCFSVLSYVMDKAMENLIEENFALKCAEEAGLRYAPDSIKGYTRRRAGKGYAYYDTRGNKITNQATLARIRSLNIPHIWTNVWISPYKDGHLQATGIDTKKRKQYRYHPKWEEQRSGAKYSKMLQLGKALPQMRKQIEEDLKEEKLTRRKVLATLAALLDRTFIRIGNDYYSENNKSYGLTTLRDKHLKAEGDAVKIAFNGKKNVYREISIEDERLARIIKKCKDVPGYRLFQYYDNEGNKQPVSSGDVNVYLREISGIDLTAKDFRTWGGSVEALKVLLDSEAPEKEKDIKKVVTGAVKAVSQKLGNTVAVCRSYYIHPLVMNTYSESRLQQFVQKNTTIGHSGSRLLSTEEKLFMKLLESEI